MEDFVRILVTVVLICAFESCGSFVSPENAIRAAHAFGFSEARVLDHNYFFLSFRGCGLGDAAMFPMTARNPAGENTNFYVCTGYLKGSTIRTY